MSRAARRRVLNRLAERLRGPQPAPKRLRGPRPAPDPGVRERDVVQIWNRERTRSALFAVTALQEVDRGRWPVLLGLYWDGGAIPDADELAALPYLSSVSIEFDGDRLPDETAIAFPEITTVMVTRRGDELPPDIGQVVAHGVSRQEDWAEWAQSSFTGWGGVADLVERTNRFDVCLEATRRRLSRYGDDPRAWVQEQTLLAREPPAFFTQQYLLDL